MDEVKGDSSRSVILLLGLKLYMEKIRTLPYMSLNLFLICWRCSLLRLTMRLMMACSSVPGGRGGSREGVAEGRRGRGGRSRGVAEGRRGRGGRSREGVVEGRRGRGGRSREGVVEGRRGRGGRSREGVVEGRRGRHGRGKEGERGSVKVRRGVICR